MAAAISGGDFLYADDVFVDGLRAPEAAAGENGDLFGGFFGKSGVERGHGQRAAGHTRRAGDGPDAIPSEIADDGYESENPSEFGRFGREFHGRFLAYSPEM